MRGLPFYVDERMIVPRSFIGELLDSHFGGESDEERRLADRRSRLRCATCSTSAPARDVWPFSPRRHFPQCTDRRGGYLRGCARGRRAQRRRLWSRGPGEIASGRSVWAARRPPLRPDHFQSALCRCARAWRTCRANAAPSRNSPSTAAPTGSISSAVSWNEAGRHLTAQGGLLCEIGRCRPALEAAYPQTDFLWLDTEESDGEVFWIGAAGL